VTSRPDKITPEEPSGREPEPFLARWSRRKEEVRSEAREPVPQKAPDAQEAPPELPPLDKLTPESDYRGFFHPKVSEDTRRAALKKLFSDPHFNVMDGLDVYIDDYSKSEPIPAVMLASLRQAQSILQWAKEEKEERAGEAALQPAAAQALEAPSAEAAPGSQTGSGAADAVTAMPRNASSQTQS
jgi:hypothetical protein